MWTPEYFVRYAPFPPSIEGVTLPNDDGSFDIYINAALSPARQADRLQHELRHIQADHFYRDTAPVAACEAEAEGKAPTPAAQTESPARRHIKNENSAAAERIRQHSAAAAAAPTPQQAEADTGKAGAADYFPGIPAGQMPHFDSPEAFLRYYLANVGAV